MLVVCGGASPPSRSIPNPVYEQARLIVPAGSPVTFRSFDAEGTAHFNGRFVLAGTFTYSCEDCEGDLKPANFAIAITPDPAVAARLPRWSSSGDDFRIFLKRDDRLARSIGTARQRRALFAGKLDELRGRVAITVDDYQASFECDSPAYSARFVAIVRRPRLTKRPLGGYGCG